MTWRERERGREGGILSLCISLQDDRDSSVVHSLDTNIKSSFKKFKNTSLDAKNTGKYISSGETFLIIFKKIVDFSDTLGRPIQHGFRAEPSEYGMQTVAREPETLMQVKCMSHDMIMIVM